MFVVESTVAKALSGSQGVGAYSNPAPDRRTWNSRFSRLHTIENYRTYPQIAVEVGQHPTSQLLLFLLPDANGAPSIFVTF
jgi:hypothetical protein